MDNQMPNSCSMDRLFDDILKDNRHACSHTHTCFHVHTKILPAAQTDDDEKVVTEYTSESVETKSNKRPSGNREAVRKYRQKKKARVASVEEEIVRLRTINQHLLKRLQGQAALKSEVARLKCLLVDVRGRIEGEIGSFPYQKQPTKDTDRIPQNMSNWNLPGSFVVNPCDGIQQNIPNCNSSLGSYAVNPCDFQFVDDQLYCKHHGMDNTGSGETGLLNGEGFGAGDVGYVPCTANSNSGYKEPSDCGQINIGSNVNLNPSAANKRKDRIIH